MYEAYQQPTTRQYGPWLSFVKQKYRKGYAIPGLEYQANGIRSYTLWNTRDSVIRILPGYDPATGEIFPQNIRCNEYVTDGSYKDYLSDTFMTASIVAGFGQQGMTFITSYAPGSADQEKWGGNTVIKIFTRNVANTVTAAQQGKKSRFGIIPEMRKWCDPMNGPLKYDHMALLVQALVFKINGRDSQDANKNPIVDEEGNPLPLLGVVGIDSKASIGAVMQALVEPANPGMPLNPATNNKYGSMCELDSNVLYLNSVDNPNGKGHMLRPSVQAPGKGWTPTPFPLTAEDVKSLWVPWEELLQYMTAEEQLSYLANEFGSDSVNYFVGTDPLFAGKLEIPEEIKNAGYGRYQQFMGGSATVSTATQTSGIAKATFGMPKMGQANKVESALNAGFVSAPKPQGPVFGNTKLGPDGTLQSTPPRPKTGLTGLRPNSTIDQNQLRAALAGIHGKQASASQSNLASQILTDNNLEDYSEDIPEPDMGSPRMMPYQDEEPEREF